MASISRLLFITGTFLASPVAAQELKPLCPDRGAFQPCTVDPGHIQVEIGLLDWFQDADDTRMIADAVVRLGLDDTSEVQLAMSPMVRKSFAQGRGDLRLSYRKRLVEGDFSLAVQPSLQLPTGSQGLSGDRLIPGIAIGSTYDLTPSTQFYLTPYAVKGQNLLGGTFLGVNQIVHGPLGASAEVMFQHQKGETQSSADFTLTYTVGSRMEFDTSANFGLTRQTPAVELVVGVTRRF